MNPCLSVYLFPLVFPSLTVSFPFPVSFVISLLPDFLCYLPSPLHPSLSFPLPFVTYLPSLHLKFLLKAFPSVRPLALTISSLSLPLPFVLSLPYVPAAQIHTYCLPITFNYLHILPLNFFPSSFHSQIFLRLFLPLPALTYLLMPPSSPSLHLLLQFFFFSLSLHNPRLLPFPSRYPTPSRLSSRPLHPTL